MPSLRAVKRVLSLTDELPVKIGHRAVLVNRVGSEGTEDWIDRELEALGVARLENIPQDDEVERAGAVGQNIFTLREEGPALAAVKEVVQGLRTKLSPT